MRTRTSWLALLLTAGVALAPAAARGQDYTKPDPVIPLPLYHDRPETGGFFGYGEFLLFRQTNPLQHQVIATRGLVDFDGSITAALNGTVVEPITVNQTAPPFILPGTRLPGTFIGSNRPALFADDAGGPSTYQPGFSIGGGWRFRNGVVIDINWWHLAEAKYAAVASLVPGGNPPLQAGGLLSESFLFSPVYNFPNDYAGPAQKIALGDPFAAYGIWNGASVETITFIQRFDQYDITGRIPIYEDDCNRCYGLIGPRLTWIWEKFKWRVVGQDSFGNAGQDDVALYTNMVSNRMYGAHVGCGYERRLGDSPIGTFSLSVDLQVALLLDVVKEVAKYERGDFETSARRAATQFTVVPEAQAVANLWWFPIEGVQIRVGYDFAAFFNTVASPNPVSFNYGGLDPPFERGHTRFLDGFTAGIGFIF
jgi:hypothetical protein